MHDNGVIVDISTNLGLGGRVGVVKDHGDVVDSHHHRSRAERRERILDMHARHVGACHVQTELLQRRHQAGKHAVDKISPQLEVPQLRDAEQQLNSFEIIMRFCAVFGGFAAVICSVSILIIACHRYKHTNPAVHTHPR